jgi:superfamily I DNA and/or RNA helicase
MVVGHLFLIFLSAKGLDPRVMLIEEAGQVLEAHVLGSLVPSVEHLIMIGDPLQLRPTLNNFCEYSTSSVHQGPYGLSSSLYG